MHQARVADQLFYFLPRQIPAAMDHSGATVAKCSFRNVFVKVVAGLANCRVPNRDAEPMLPDPAPVHLVQSDVVASDSCHFPWGHTVRENEKRRAEWQAPYLHDRDMPCNHLPIASQTIQYGPVYVPSRHCDCRHAS